MATKKKRLPLITPIQFAAIVTSTISLILLIGFFYKMAAFEEIKKDAARIQQKWERAVAEHEDLTVRKTYVQSDAYIEQVAREELNWGRPGDTIIRVKSINSRPKATPEVTEDVPASAAIGPQWQAWYDVFFGELPQAYGY
jgi:cell division protein FtsB